MDILLTLAVAVAVLILVALGSYNGLASARQDVRVAWGRLDDQLRRRYDLLPPLVARFRAAGTPVPAPLAAAVAAKNAAAVAFNPQQLAAAEADLTAGLRGLLADPPASPAARPADDGVRADVLAAESRIDASARDYNDRVGDYNAALASFPHEWTAAAFGFKPQPRFEVGPGPGPDSASGGRI